MSIVGQLQTVSKGKGISPQHLYESSISAKAQPRKVVIDGMFSSDVDWAVIGLEIRYAEYRPIWSCTVA